jgi:hypothetical protein
MLALFFLFLQSFAAEDSGHYNEVGARSRRPLPSLHGAGEKPIAENNRALVDAAADLASGIVRDDIEDEKFSVASAISRGGGNGRADRRRGGVANIDMCADGHFVRLQERMKQARAG